LVYNLLEYGTKERGNPATRPRKLMVEWEIIVRFLSSPINFFDLQDVKYRFGKFAGYAQGSPLMKPTDRMAILSLSGLLVAFDRNLSDSSMVGEWIVPIAAQWGDSLARQCGVLGEWIMREGRRITGLYNEGGQPGPLKDVDQLFDKIMNLVNEFPKYLALRNAAMRVRADFLKLPLMKALQNPQTEECLRKYEGYVQENARAKFEAAEAEQELRAKFVEKRGRENGELESAEAIERLKREALSR
jgi:hypothetical protein